MTLPKWHTKSYNVETGVETITEYTPKEIEAAEAKQAEFLAQVEALQAERDAEQALKDAARQVVLDKLGLTADEVAALLG